jgi:hypothetical protein
MGNAYYKMEFSNAFVKMDIKGMESINAKVNISRIHNCFVIMD